MARITDESRKQFQVAYTGKWRPSIDGAMMAEGDMQTLTNMRYTDSGIKSISGMSKINTTALTTYTKLRSGLHFRNKRPPTAESHVLVQAFNSAESQAVVKDNATAVPSQGDFASTTLYTDTAGSGVGHFSSAPDGAVTYCNAKESCIWSGSEARVPAFIVGNSTFSSAKIYDYTSVINNTLTSAANLATLTKDGTTAYVYIGALRPIQGIKFYVSTANTAACTATVKYWNGSAWAAVSSLVDGTAAAGVSLAQTGTMSFTSTVGTAKLGVFNGDYLYWYQVALPSIDAAVKLYFCSLDSAMQPITDLWNGTPRALAAFYNYSATAVYTDYSVQTYTQDFASTDTATYVNLTGSNTWILCMAQQITAIQFGLAAGYANSNAATITISYFDGAAWQDVTATDNTAVAGATLAQSGWITWTAPAANAEFPAAINGNPPMYLYKIITSAALSATVYVDYIYTIPAPDTILPYRYAVEWQNRLVLVGEIEDKKNSFRISAYGTNCVFNGSDTLEFTELGDNSLPTAAGALFTRYTGNFYDTLIICKPNEVYVLDGTTLSDFKLYRVSGIYGCVAPESFKILPVGFEVTGGVNRHIAIWQSSTGVVMFDGNSIQPIDADIKNYFDPASSDCINSSYATKSYSFVDEREREYHLLLYSGTSATLTELVYHTGKKGWYKVERNPTITCGFTVNDDNNVPYCYGGTNTGYLERLENGATFDSNAMTFTVKTRDTAFAGWAWQTEVLFAKLITLSKAAGSVVLTHFGDTRTTATTDKSSFTTSLVNALRRLVQGKKRPAWDSSVFHSFQATLTTSTQQVPFEPVGIAGFFTPTREDE